LNHPKAKGEERAIFQKKIEKYKKANKTIIYIDESGFAHDMPRTHGYAPKGQRCYGKHDWGARGRTNAIGALLGKELLTISLFEQNINTNIFNSWLSQDLIPKVPVGSIIVLDNAAFHKSKDMQEQLKVAGHTLEYLPAYSPDLNPIEPKWAQAKSVRRKHSCTIESLFRDFCT
jgi:transposase